jgi:hypothetical protein
VKGLSSIGSLPEVVAAHKHEVEMNVVRFDVGLKYQLNRHLQLETVVPYEIKDQNANVGGLENIDDPEVRRKILLYQEIHHRDETYQGISDMELLIAYRKHGIFGQNDMLTAKLGTTIPFGRTEDDPWILGDMGMEHLHIQFGTGTFNPIADLRYSFPVYGGLRANASVRGKYPFYENSKTYRGSWDVTYTGGLNYRVTDWLSLQTSYLGLYQSYAHWDGEIDINTGLRFSMASLGTSIATPYNVPLTITLMLPIQQETLYDDSASGNDAFKLGGLVSVTALYSF